MIDDRQCLESQIGRIINERPLTGNIRDKSSFTLYTNLVINTKHNLILL